jgi:hypothetical protein
LDSIIKNDPRYTREIKSRIAVAKVAFNRKKTLSTSPLALNLRKKLAKCYCWKVVFYGAEIWKLRKLHQKYLESFEMLCWRRIEKIIWTDHGRNEEILHRVKEDRNILHTVKRRKTNWIGHRLFRNYLLIHITEGK